MMWVASIVMMPLHCWGNRGVALVARIFTVSWKITVLQIPCACMSSKFIFFWFPFRTPSSRREKMQELLNSVDATLARYNSGALSTEGVTASPGSTSSSRPPATSTPTNSMDIQTGHDYVIERWDLYCWLLLYCRANLLQEPTRGVRNCLGNRNMVIFWLRFCSKMSAHVICALFLTIIHYGCFKIVAKISEFSCLVIFIWGSSWNHGWADVFQPTRRKIDRDHSGRLFWGQWSYPLSFCKFPIMLIHCYSVKFWMAFHYTVNRTASWLDDTG